MKRFGAGEIALVDSKGMMMSLARLLLVRVDEHQAEGPHALMKRELGHSPNASASLLSLSQRLPHWEDLLASDPSILKLQAANMAQVYNAIDASLTLNISPHPALHRMFAACFALVDGRMHHWKDKGRLHMTLVKGVVYHVDRHSRYMDVQVEMDDGGPNTPSHAHLRQQRGGGPVGAVSSATGSSASPSVGASASGSSSSCPNPMAPSSSTSCSSGGGGAGRWQLDSVPRRMAALSYFREKLAGGDGVCARWFSIPKGSFDEDFGFAPLANVWARVEARFG